MQGRSCTNEAVLAFFCTFIWLFQKNFVILPMEMKKQVFQATKKNNNDSYNDSSD